MPSLLTLPRELRDEILTYVLLSSVPCPRTLHDLSRTHNTLIHDNTYFASHKYLWFANFTSTLTPVSNSLALLLTNHQIYAETNNALVCLRRSDELSYRMDIEYVQEGALFLHWISVPQITAHPLNHLKVDFHTVGVLEKHQFTYSWGRSRGLEHLLPLITSMARRCVIPAFGASKPLIRNLEINFISPYPGSVVVVSPMDVLSPHSFKPRPLHSPYPQHHDDTWNTRLEPGVLCETFCKHIEKSLSFQEEGVNSLGVEKVILRVNGREVAVIEIKTGNILFES